MRTEYPHHHPAAALSLVLLLWAALSPLTPPIVDAQQSDDWPCGWPLLRENSPDPPQKVNTMTVQLLLNFRMGAALSVDGVYGPATAQMVSTFQTHDGLQVDGEMGPQTWSHLVVQCSSTENNRGDAVLAIQQQLDYWKFTIPQTSAFDSATVVCAHALGCPEWLS
jgi:Putative peptidoglycan binding domain